VLLRQLALRLLRPRLPLPLLLPSLLLRPRCQQPQQARLKALPRALHGQPAAVQHPQCTLQLPLDRLMLALLPPLLPPQLPLHRLVHLANQVLLPALLLVDRVLVRAPAAAAAAAADQARGAALLQLRMRRCHTWPATALSPRLPH
jgi:hypothetical protein